MYRERRKSHHTPALGHPATALGEIARPRRGTPAGSLRLKDGAEDGPPRRRAAASWGRAALYALRALPPLNPHTATDGDGMTKAGHEPPSRATGVKAIIGHLWRHGTGARLGTVFRAKCGNWTGAGTESV